MIETVPLEQAADACARMMQGKTRFRMVLVAKDGNRSRCAAQLIRHHENTDYDE